jgi:CheY-like chemotaxis protein
MWATEQPRHRLRVLVADDCAGVREALQAVLQRWDHEVQVVADGWAAVDLAVAWRPDVVVLDLDMPRLDGCDAATWLRYAPGLGRTLLVALTAYPWDDDMAHGRVPVFDYYLTKPPNFDLLRRLIESAPALAEG